MRRLPLLLLLLTGGCRVDESVEARERAPIALRAELPAPPPLPRATAHYALRARLDEKRHEVAGSATVTWTNRSDRATDELRLHLYLNAFRKGSLFLRGAGGRSGGLVGREGRIEVRHLVSPTFGGQDLWPAAERHTPGDPADQTDVRVPLPGPVLAGQRLELEIEFVSVLPEIVERTGYHGNYHFIGQWFPKLARLEPDGTWAHFPFHAFAEFYADFDDYEVVLDVPKSHHVGAVGTLSPLPDKEPGRARYLASAHSVVDFAWTSSPSSRKESRQLGPTRVHLLSEEGEPHVRRTHWQTVEDGLAELGRWLGAYPYPELTVVVPPRGAERSGGMEYPSLITTGGGELVSRLGVRSVELLIIHELAHQWFQSLVATNEPEYPFLDEGLASYAEWRFLQSRYGSGSLASVLGLQLSRNAGGRFAAFLGRRSPVRINQPARDFPSFQALAREVYCRTPLVLETLARTFSRERVDSAVAAYARTARGTHPRPAEFYETLARYLGPEHLPTIVELFDEAGSFNLKLVSTQSTPEPDGRLETRIVVERDGGPGLPYEVSIEFEGGERTVLHGPGQTKRETLTVVHRRPAVRVDLDPNEHLLLDEDPTDDRLDARTGRAPESNPENFLSALTISALLLSHGLSP